MGPLFIPPSRSTSTPDNAQFELSTPAYERVKPQTSVLRKHVLLAQDCVAIKFTRTHHQTPHSCNYVQTEIIDAFSLFNSFKSSNKKCHWNKPLADAISSIEFKGHIHPSTILVSTSPPHTDTIRNAWSRRIIRDPPGFRAEFLGEVEEIVTQPVQQGQFAPLSDSLCWAISEITDSAQEAFIDSITKWLEKSFPNGFSQPPRELIFQTLEKLIKSQKIYQTSNGYFIVTPDVSSFISYSRNVTPQIYGRIYSDFDKQSTSRYSTPWGSTPSVSNDHTYEIKRVFESTMKRHNSLKIIRPRNDPHFPPNPSMGARSLSFRLSKCNSMFDSDKESDESEQKQTEQPKVQTTKKKQKSFLTRLFRFRCTRAEKREKIWGKDVPSSASSSVSGIYASISQARVEYSGRKTDSSEASR